MTDLLADTWHGANQRYLAAELHLVRVCLERHTAGAGRDDLDDAERAARAERDAAAAALAEPAALDTLCATFGLTPFERATLLLCAGMELDARFPRLCAEAQAGPDRPFPTFSLALAALPEAHWSALTPDAPLRRWRLIEVGAGPALTLSPLRIDERVLHYLAGLETADESLAGLVQPLQKPAPLTEEHTRIAARAAAAWREARAGSLPVIQLCGDDPAATRALAHAVAAAVGLRLVALPAASVPVAPAELDLFIRLWEREAALGRTALLVEWDDADAPEAARLPAVTRLVERARAAIVLAGRQRRALTGRATVTFDVRRPGMAEQRLIWQRALAQAGVSVNGRVEALVSQFNLGTAAIDAAVAEALGRGEHDAAGALWEACRYQARPRMENLARRIEPAATWDDLVLPDAQLATLQQIAAHARQRARVYETWGFGARESRGLGVTALFAGASGTGKTLAAEVLAHALNLDLYRIDLSQVVSKYIGETEANLRRVFDAAEEGGAVLLFDEADALFGKRSEVKDSHDRYANIEISYLLQRMEAYRGLAILTTNMKGALDPAFLRRLRFVVHFPFPDAERRARIWRRIFPPATPTEGLDAGRLAQLNVSGGHIRNIALHAAFLAADAGGPVRMSHLLRAARTEYAKIERSLTDAETEGWQ
jgi:hypothetical protein